MSNINVPEVLSSMLAAAQGVFDQKWPQVKDFAETEFEKLAQTLSQIEKLRITNQITEGEASVLLEMQKNTARAVMLALQGMGLVLVEQAINAALLVVKDTVNGAIGFVLI